MASKPGTTTSQPSKTQISSWIRQILPDTSSKLKVEDLGTGVIYCRIVSHYFPGSINLHRINLHPKNQYEYTLNLKLFQNTLTQHKVTAPFDMGRISKLKFLENWNLINCLYKQLVLNSQQTLGNNDDSKSVVSQTHPKFTPKRSFQNKAHLEDQANCIQKNSYRQQTVRDFEEGSMKRGAPSIGHQHAVQNMRGSRNIQNYGSGYIRQGINQAEKNNQFNFDSKMFEAQYSSLFNKQRVESFNPKMIREHSYCYLGNQPGISGQYNVQNQNTVAQKNIVDQDKKLFITNSYESVIPKRSFNGQYKFQEQIQSCPQYKLKSYTRPIQPNGQCYNFFNNQEPFRGFQLPEGKCWSVGKLPRQSMKNLNPYFKGFQTCAPGKYSVNTHIFQHNHNAIIDRIKEILLKRSHDIQKIRQIKLLLNIPLNEDVVKIQEEEAPAQSCDVPNQMNSSKKKQVFRDKENYLVNNQQGKIQMPKVEKDEKDNRQGQRNENRQPLSNVADVNSSSSNGSSDANSRNSSLKLSNCSSIKLKGEDSKDSSKKVKNPERTKDYITNSGKNGSLKLINSASQKKIKNNFDGQGLFFRR